MSKSKVAILKTKPSTVRSDYHELLNLADYQEVVARDADTALKGAGTLRPEMALERLVLGLAI